MTLSAKPPVIDFQILGIGAWGEMFRSWQDLSAVLRGESVECEPSKGPKPEIIPANERRRAPLTVRLAVESSTQAARNAQLDPSKLASIFVSGLGDTQLSDYMCKTLADNSALSPTKFHNSVHNAAAGYWTISTGCHQASSSMAGFGESVSLALMEALAQSQSEQKPILITFHDAPCSEIFKNVLKNDTAFTASLIIDTGTSIASKPTFTATIIEQTSDWPELDCAAVRNCYRVNPAAKILALLDLLSVENSSSSLLMPLSSQTSLKVTSVNSTGI